MTGVRFACYVLGLHVSREACVSRVRLACEL